MKASKHLVLVSTLAAIALPLTAHATSSVCDAVAGNLVTNCGFETGDFTGWTRGGTLTSTGVISATFFGYSPNSGNHWAALGPEGSDGTLSQTLLTSDGTEYTFDFYLATEGEFPSDFSAYWDGTQLLSLTDTNSDSAYTLYSYTVEGTGSDTIQFDFRDDPGFIALDDVSVAPAPVATTPEPGSLSLLLLGLAAVFLGRRRLLAQS